MTRGSRILTTGDVAGHCGVSRMGVLRWIRAGKLKAFTTPGGHYRIRINNFRAFLEQYDMPVDGPIFNQGARGVLVIANDAPVLGTVVKALSTMSEGLEIDVAIDGPSAVDKIADSKPGLVVVDTLAPEIETPALTEWFQDNQDTQDIPVLILSAPASTQPDGKGLSSLDLDGRCSLQRASLETDTLQSTVRELLQAQ